MIPPKITQKVTYLINSCIKCVSLKYQIFKSTFLESAHILVLVNHMLALSDWMSFQSCLCFTIVCTAMILDERQKRGRLIAGVHFCYFHRHVCQTYKMPVCT